MKIVNKPLENVYNVGVSAGGIFALIFALFCTFIFIASIYGGIKLLIKEPSHLSESSEGIIKNLQGNCIKSNPTSNSVLYKCNINVEYPILNGTKQVKVFNTSSNIEYIVGNTITVHYNPNNPSESSLGSQISSKTSGIFMIIVGVCSLIFGWIFYYIVKKMKDLQQYLEYQKLLI